MTIGALNRTARSRTEADTFALAAELRYGWGLGGRWSAGPSAIADHVSTGLGDLAETGADALNLAGSDNDARRSRYGAGAFARWQGASGFLDAAAHYVRAGGEVTDARLTFAGAPSLPFRVRAATGYDEEVLLALRGEAALGAGWTAGADIRAAIGSREQDVAGSVALRLRF